MVELEKLRAEYVELVKDIGDNYDKAKQIKVEIDEAEAVPKKALARYEECKKHGDEKGMNKALADIRTADERSSKIYAKFDEPRAADPIFRDRQKELHKKLNKLSTEQREHWEEMTKKLELDFKKTVLLVKQTEVILDQLDKLAKMIPAKKE